MISSEARSRIHHFGRKVCEIQQSGIPFNVPLGIPIVNPFVWKQLLFKAQYKLIGVDLEEVGQGILFGNFRSFMDMKMETYSRRKRTRHFKINPFTIKMGEAGQRYLGEFGMRRGHALASFMVSKLGLVEWEVSEEPRTDPDVVSLHVDLRSKYFGGHFKFRVRRHPEGVILDDDWLPEGGGDVRTPSLPMGNLVLKTHPLGFEQIAERVVEEIVQARAKGCPYVGQIGPPSQELAEAGSLA
jgi:hypothetical protein